MPTRLRSASWPVLAALSLLAAVPVAPAPQTGTVTGKITTGKVNTKGTASDKDVVVYLVPKKPVPLVPPATAVPVLQKQLNYEPHVLPVTTGTKVVFRNEDRIKHNVWCKDGGGEMDTDTDAAASVEKVYDKAGVKNITCRLHPDMSMYVVVVDTPHFTTCAIERGESNGQKTFTATYKLTDVPAGEYTLKTWNKKLAAVEQTVVVEAGKTLDLNLELAK